MKVMRSKSVILNILTNLILQFITIIYGFIVPKIIISNYGSNVNGLISSITQFLAYITLLESGFGPVVKSLLYKPIAKKNKEEIENILKTSEKFFRKIAIIFILYIIILCFVYPMINTLKFDYLYTISLIIIISISTFCEYYFGMTYKLYLQSEQKTYIISIIQILTYILSIFSILICVKIGVTIQIIKLISGIIFILRPLLQNMYVKRKFKINLKNANDNFEIKNKYDGLAQHIAYVIHTNTDITIITFFCNMLEVSVYSVYYLVVKGVKAIIQAFSSGIDSIFGDMLAKNEEDNLKIKFNIYEVLYLTIITICFTCTIILIVPFIKVYTKGITDVNYIRPCFGVLIVISEYIWAIRLPYSSTVLAAGKFKETRVGAWIECITNIIISMILVFKFGIVGVAIGTIFAMLFRTIEFILFFNKNILKISPFNSFKKIIIAILESLLIVFTSRYLHFFDLNGYLNLIINMIIVFIYVTVIVLFINYIFYKKEFKEIISILKKTLLRRKKSDQKQIKKN